MASPVLALDLDGVVVNLMPEIFRRLTEAGHPLPTWEQPPTFRWTTKESGLPKKAINFVIGLYADPQLYAKAQPMEGAIDGIRSLLDQGWLIVAVTSRKHHTAQVTHDWLDSYGYGDLPVIMGVKDKASLVKRHGFTVAVDDAPHHLEEYLARGVDGIVFDRAYNRNVVGLTRCENWHELVEYLDRISFAHYNGYPMYTVREMGA